MAKKRNKNVFGGMRATSTAESEGGSRTGEDDLHRQNVEEPEVQAWSVAVINRRAAARVRAGHPWVYQSDVETITAPDGGEISAGSLVYVTDHRGELLGTALFSNASLITLRIITRDELTSREEFLELLRQRLTRAIQLRLNGVDPSSGTDSCRLVFSEADELPGMVIDKYSDLIILQLLTQGMYFDDVRVAVVEVSRKMLAPKTILERPDPRIRELEQLASPSSEPLYAANADAPKLSTTFQINGLKFLFDSQSGQKTGAFLDQRENYAAAARYAHGRALDVCTYQGGFALHLARNCPQVTGVDVSRAALEIAELNLDENRNQMAEQGRGVEWMEADAFELLREWSDTGEKFETIVLDPPAFAKSRRAVESAMRGYKEMNLRALKMLQAGATLVTCSCSHHVSLADFQAVVAAAASDAKKRVRLLEIRGAAFDHPAILTIPETQYLKCLICRVE